MKRRLPPVRPGEILLKEFLKPMGVSQNRLAVNIGVRLRGISEIVFGKRAISADTALQFARFFGTSAEFWLGLQSQYDLNVAADELGDPLNREVRTLVTAG